MRSPLQRFDIHVIDILRFQENCRQTPIGVNKIDSLLWSWKWWAIEVHGFYPWLRFNNPSGIIENTMQANSYIFDGTFEGFLTVFSQICQDGQAPAGIMDKSQKQGDLFSLNLKVSSDSEKASQVWEECRKRLSRNSLNSILYCFLSSRNDFYMALYNYIALGWKHGKNLAAYQANQDVRFVHKVSQEVGLEIHRFTGLLRFPGNENRDIYMPIFTGP
jgi:hypothetical protein